MIKYCCSRIFKMISVVIIVFAKNQDVSVVILEILKIKMISIAILEILKNQNDKYRYSRNFKKSK